MSNIERHNKKRGSYTTITGLVIGFMLIVGVLLIVRSCSNVPKTQDKLVDEFISAITEVSSMSPGSGKIYSFKFERETAIVGMNSDATAFRYIYSDTEDNPNKTFYVKGKYMEKPASCSKDHTCVCMCDGFDLETRSESNINTEDAFITCKKLICKPAPNVVFESKSYMKDVFTYKVRYWTKDVKNSITFSTGSIVSDEDPPVKDFYWDKSAIIVRSAHLDPTDWLTLNSAKHTPRVVAGYRDIYPTEIIDVYIMNSGQNSVRLCFKEDLRDCKI